ncbi:hypothetical protein WJX84_000304 [Apatococcus fuscideae]|uniref:Rieske domain-containing protein n=1 Tax=Apatococcus fuscideae TaxID=2026836 RepID=A0AAW1RE73_9CHLO
MWRSTAQLQLWNDTFYHKIEAERGLEVSTKVAEGHRFGIDNVKKVCDEEGIDCGFKYVDGHLYPKDEESSSYDLLEQELQASNRAGLSDVKWVDLGGGQDVGGIRRAVQFPRCANFDPIRYCEGLAKAISKRGGAVYETSRVKKAEGQTVTTEAGQSIQTPVIVFATHSPTHKNLAVHARQFPEKLYAVALQIPKGGMADGQFWDTEAPYHSVRFVEGTSKGDCLLVRGNNHTTGIKPEEIDADTYEKLAQWARSRWPKAGEVAFEWSGQLYAPIDRLALYGQDPFNAFHLDGTYYIATGDAGQGTIGGQIAGKVISQQILGQEGPWSEMFAPARLPPPSKDILSALGHVISDTTAGYVDIASPAGAQMQNADGLAKDSGAIIQQGDAPKIAVYVDEDGVQHKHSAICPHMGCVVQWSPIDRSFNCPCHGAGFDRFGKIVQGPATSDLEPVK